MGHSFDSRKGIGEYGERAAAEYLRRRGFAIKARNIRFKTGELDIVAVRDATLHVIEVKTLQCLRFPVEGRGNGYIPADNLHAKKLEKVKRTAEWYAAKQGWRGDLQVDAALVWVRRSDHVALVSYISQVL